MTDTVFNGSSEKVPAYELIQRRNMILLELVMLADELEERVSDAEMFINEQNSVLKDIFSLQIKLNALVHTIEELDGK